MDDFSRKYTVVLVVALFLGLVWWAFNRDTVAADINDRLASDAELAAYPYTFRVLSVDNGVAAVSSPRSADIVAEHPDVRAVSWRLDEEWYARRGIYLDTRR